MGNKTDLRQDKPGHVSKETAAKVVKELGCIYLECSALTSEGLAEVFHQGIRSVIDIKKEKKKSSSFCTLI